MTEWYLKYGLNPHQGDAVASFPDGEPWIEVLNGSVGYINLLDALRAWTLARELADALHLPSAASIKHVHPAGAAVAGPLEAYFRAANRLGDEDFSALATAYARARAGDRIAAFGDFIGLSDVVDESCARLIAREVSDGVIAPGYAPDALQILRQKKKGTYIVLRAACSYIRGLRRSLLSKVRVDRASSTLSGNGSSGTSWRRPSAQPCAVPPSRYRSHSLMMSAASGCKHSLASL